MISFKPDTDATQVYRENSSLKTIRMDSTGDTGSLLAVMRDSVVVIGAPNEYRGNEHVIVPPSGVVDASARG